MRRPFTAAPTKRKRSGAKVPQVHGNMGVHGGVEFTHGPGGTVDQVAKVELVQRRRWVLDLARAGMSIPRITEAAAERRPTPMDGAEVRAIYSEYLAELKLRYASEIPAARVAQLDRLFNSMTKILAGDVVLYKGTPATTNVLDGEGRVVGTTQYRKVNWSAYFQCEHEIALILGTHAPKVIAVEVDVNATLAQSMQRVIGEMTADDFDRIAEEAAAREAAALVSRAEGSVR